MELIVLSELNDNIKGKVKFGGVSYLDRRKMINPFSKKNQSH